MTEEQKYLKYGLQRAKKQRLIALKNSFKTIDCFAECSLAPEDYNSYERIKNELIKTYSGK